MPTFLGSINLKIELLFLNFEHEKKIIRRDNIMELE